MSQRRFGSPRPERRSFSDLCPSLPGFYWLLHLCGARAGFGGLTRHRNKHSAATSLSSWSKFQRLFLTAEVEKLRPLRRSRTSLLSKSRWGKTVLPSDVSFLSTHCQRIQSQKQKPRTDPL